MNNNSLMYHNGNESKKLKDRLHEGYVLFLFIFLSAIASIIVMDILVLPIAIFAVTKKEAFLLLFGDFFWMFIGTLFVFLLIRRIIALKKDGIPAKNIMLHIITKPFRAIALLLVIIASGIGLIGILYLLMSYNSYFIYKLFS